VINSNWHPILYRFGVIAAYCSNFGHCVFEPPYGGLGTSHDVHLGLIGKRVVDFLFVLIELFRYVLRLRRYGGRLTHSFTWKGSPPTNHSSFQKTSLNDLSYGVKIGTDLSSVSRLTDGQTEFSSLNRVCIPCSAVKTAQTFRRLTLISNQDLCLGSPLGYL